jgi:hypothetical protein
MIEIFVTDSAEALAAISADGDKNVWINGRNTVISTGDDYTPDGEVATVLDAVPPKAPKKAKTVAEVVDAPNNEGAELTSPAQEVVETQPEVVPEVE